MNVILPSIGIKSLATWVTDLLLFSQAMSYSLWPHGLQHARLPCPLLSPRVCSNSWPLSWWCHPTISSSVAPFCSCPQSFPESGSFPMSQLFASGGQRIGASASTSVLVVVQSPSHVRLFVTLWTAAHQASLSLTISCSLPKFMSIALVMPPGHLILWCPLLLHSIFPSIRDFSNQSALHIRWPKYWSFSFSISPSSKYSGLISIKIDWFDLLVVQGTLRCLLQHHSLKASILLCSTFFTVQLS